MMVKGKMGPTKESIETYGLVMMPGSYNGFDKPAYVDNIVSRLFESKSKLFFGKIHNHKLTFSKTKPKLFRPCLADSEDKNCRFLTTELKCGNQLLFHGSDVDFFEFEKRHNR